MEEKKPGLGSRTESWRRKKQHWAADRDGVRNDREQDRVTERVGNLKRSRIE